MNKDDMAGYILMGMVASFLMVVVIIIAIIYIAVETPHEECPEPWQVKYTQEIK